MNLLAEKIHDFARETPNKLAIQGDRLALNYQDLIKEIDCAASSLGLTERDETQTFAILLDNHPAWAVIDLALCFNTQCTVPLPRFFSISQLRHALLDSDADYLILDDTSANTQIMSELGNFLSVKEIFYVADKKIKLLSISKMNNNDSTSQQLKTQQLKISISKITYTSGTTDKPKGVLLSEDVIMSKVKSLVAASESDSNDISLTILPLSTLLENIGGLYVPFYCGASAIILSPETTGLSGSSKINPELLLNAIQQYNPTTFIIIPQLLLLLVNAVSKAYKLSDSVRFIAMGGAPVSRKLLKQAEQLKIPVYEGYGFSEAASVISVNNEQFHRLGSVGQILDSHQVKISKEGEILVQANLFNGYLGQANRNNDEYYATGDLGHFDEDAYLYVTGRIKNVINTSFGRNISPEWIEKELETIPLIAQCVVFGHAKPYLTALIVFRGTPDDKTKGLLNESIAAVNVELPDYARVQDFILADMPFSVENSQLTGTGRPKREKIYQIYKEKIERCYDTDILEQET